MWLAGPGLIALGLWGLSEILRQWETGKPIAVTIFVAACVLGLALLGAASLGFIIRYRVSIRGEVLAVQGLIKHREIRRSEIRGFRIKGDGVTTQFVPGDPARRKVDVPIYFKPDEAFWDWFGDLEDLDFTDMETEEEEILSNDAFGATEERRADRLYAATTAVRRLNSAGGVVAIWGLVFPEPGLVRFDSSERDVYPNVAVAVLLPGLILAVRAVSDWQLLEVSSAALWALILAGVVFALWLKLPRRRGCPNRS